MNKVAIKNTTAESSKLLFGQGATDISPYFGLSKNGPYSLSPLPHIKFIFVFHKEDKDLANEMFKWFNGKMNGFSGLKSFILNPPFSS